MNKVGTDTRKSPQRLLQNNVQPALFILTLPFGNTLYLLLSIYSSITLCLNQRFKDKASCQSFLSFLSWFKTQKSNVSYLISNIYKTTTTQSPFKPNTNPIQTPIRAVPKGLYIWFNTL